MKKYICENNSDITSYLLSKGMKRSDIKSLLKYHCIFINDKKDIRYDEIVNIGDRIVIDKNHNSSDLNILYEDKDLIVIDKPCGLLTDRTEKESIHTAYNKVKDYCKKNHENIYLVHRLDQYTSGVLMFVKNKKLYDALTSNWNELVLKRNYIGVVEGNIEPKKKRLETYLYENKALITKVCDRGSGKIAITNYEVIKSNKNYSLLNIQIETGRKNQIRAHLSYLGYPIVGDDKYGAKSNPIKRLALHQNIFSFKNPLNNKVYEFESDYPKSFEQLFK